MLGPQHPDRGPTQGAGFPKRLQGSGVRALSTPGPGGACPESEAAQLPRQRCGPRPMARLCAGQSRCASLDSRPGERTHSPSARTPLCRWGNGGLCVGLCRHPVSQSCPQHSAHPSPAGTWHSGPGKQGPWAQPPSLLAGAPKASPHCHSRAHCSGSLEGKPGRGRRRARRTRQHCASPHAPQARRSLPGLVPRPSEHCLGPGLWNKEADGPHEKVGCREGINLLNRQGRAEPPLPRPPQGECGGSRWRVGDPGPHSLTGDRHPKPRWAAPPA